MRKTVILLAVMVLVAVNASALQTVTSGASAPVLYGDTVVFLSNEGVLGTDLNQDGDTSDNVLSYHDLKTSTTTHLPYSVKTFSFFAETIAFESDDGIVKVYNLRTKKLTETQTRGTQPHIFGPFVLFTTDDIVQYYLLNESRTVSLNATGNWPLVFDNKILFTTKESSVSQDLNGDEDKEDSVLRYYTFERGLVVNTRQEAATLKNDKQGNILLTVPPRQILTYDLETGRAEYISEGENPSLINGKIVFSHDDEVYTYDVSQQKLVKTQHAGKEPSIFDNRIAFTNAGTLLIAEEGDEDEDTHTDFFDNCWNISNELQEDSNKNGVGDACEPKLIEEDEEEPIEETFQVPIPTGYTPAEPPANLTVIELDESSSGVLTGILITVLVLGAVAAAYYFIPRWQRKRKKSFGF